MTKTEAKTVAVAKPKRMSLKDKWNAFWERNRKSEGYLLQKIVKDKSFRLVRAIMLFGMCFMILQPILNKISISFMEEQDIYNAMVVSIPEHFTTDNYQLAADFMSYSKSIVNTAIISLTIAVLQITVCTLVGYGFARFEFPLKKFWFACVILIIIIPPQTISTSLYLHFRFFDIFGIIEAIKGEALNLRGSVLPYYLMSAGCMGLKNGLYIFMIRQFFRTIPKELEEAAYVDGCGTLKTFVRIMLPDAKPILTSCFLFAFVWQWTDGFYSKMFLGNTQLLSTQLAIVGDRLAVYVQRLTGTVASVGYTNCIVSTATLMVIVPLLILYLFAQKGFVESLSSSGIKM
ncbi:MAG: carbohydrate ABC transporter permease [Lachnospiraceae bacterium]|nr:carbohydrate ABC transporter permease [Lachnospiraceae bacterium]